MLHGFSVPLTPQGRSSLVPPPPWHYSSDCLAIEYWTNPAAIAALLPPGVIPDEKSRGSHCARMGARLSEEIWQYLPNAEFRCAKCGRRPAREGKPVRRQCRGTRRAIGDGASAARGEGHRSREGVQSPDGDASVFPTARCRAPNQAGGR